MTGIRWPFENLRAKGPLIYLAQPNGLGFRGTNKAEGQRPGRLERRSFGMCDHPIDRNKRSGRWPSWFDRLVTQPVGLG